MKAIAPAALICLGVIFFISVIALWNALKVSRVLKSYNERVISKFPYLPQSFEVSERAAVLEHINRKDVVLEIGANVGGVSALLASILESPKNLVSIDPLAANCSHLLELGRSLKKEFNVFHGVVRGPQQIDCRGIDERAGSYCECSPSNSPLTENLTIEDIEKRFNLNFTAAVIDCEGCYEKLMPQILSIRSLSQIQIEWDGKFMEDEILGAGFKLSATYLHKHLKRGVRVYKRE
jgi:hypothetical protein